MSKIIYKILFEVQILHDYMLRQNDGTSFFDLNASEKFDFLTNQISNGLYKSIFSIAPISTTPNFLKGHNMIFKETPVGFIVGVKVNEEIVGGEIKYKPFVELSDGQSLNFSLEQKLFNLLNISNLSLSHQLPAIYYFTNDNKNPFQDDTAPPSNANPISEIPLSPQEEMIYEMGTILNFSGTLKKSTKNTNGVDSPDWEVVPERRFVSLADKRLLPHKFRFYPTQTINDVETTLKNNSDEIIKVISKSTASPLSSLELDFSNTDSLDESSYKIDSGEYTLILKQNGGTDLSFPVRLDTKLYSKNYFGVVDIKLSRGDLSYNIIDGDGFIKTKIDGGGNRISHPIFEVRIENRKTYWRYRKQTEFTIDEVNTTNQHLSLIDPKILVSNSPKSLSQTLSPFINGSSLLLPVPDSNNIKADGDKIYSEIYINKSNRLIKN